VEALLEDFRIPEGVDVVDGGTFGLGLLPYLEKADRIIVLDAVLRGGVPGTVYKLFGREVSAHLKGRVSAHQIGFQDVLALLELMERSPREIVILGLEPATIRPGTELSALVRERIPELVKECLKQLKAWGAEPKRRCGRC
jgi:hydrogenase maturation protease